ncbi:MAG TPA: hypothetical protein VGD87_04200, partial [Archangium sp.]
MRLASLVFSLCVGSACTCSERDTFETVTEEASDRALEEKTLQLSTLDERRRELALVNQALSRFVEISDSELRELLGPDVNLASRDQGFTRLLTIKGLGDKQRALVLARRLVDRSEVLLLSGVSLEADAFTLLFHVVSPIPESGSPTGTGFEPSVDDSWCFQSCRERKARLRRKAAELKALDEQLGPVSTLTRRRKRVELLFSVRKQKRCVA